MTLGVLETWMPEAQSITNAIYLVWHSTAGFEPSLSTIAVDFPHFIFSSVVRDHGVTQDQELTFAPHIHPLCRDSYYHLHQLRSLQI